MQFLLFVDILLMVLVAAKLKKEWIEKAKVKKQWKSQKRKGDVAAIPVQRDLPPHQAMDVTGSGKGVDRNDTSEGGSDHLEDVSREVAAAEGPETVSQVPVTKSTRGKTREAKGEGKEVRFAPESKKPKAARQDTAPRKSFKERLRLDSEKTQTDAVAEDEEVKPTLRELRRTAYSPASLHNVKSNQRYRHTQVPDADKNWGNHQGSSGQRKGGQPNMKLRMEAMLEQIKKDYS